MTTIRLAKPSDAPQLLSLIHALAAHHGDPPVCDRWTLMRDVFDLNPLLTIYVAENAETLTGYIALQHIAQLHFGMRGLDIHHLFISKPERGTGLGARLIGQAKRHAQATAGKFLTVSTAPDNTQAQAFYVAQGFEQTATEPPRFRLRL